MPHSYAQTQSLTCPECGRTFDAEIYLIVDAAECPFNHSCYWAGFAYPEMQVA